MNSDRDRESIIVEYYVKLFEKGKKVGNLEAIYQRARFEQLGNDQKNDLERDFNKEEVIKALKDMHPSKAPSPDEYHAAFYHKFWSVIGEETT